MSFDHDEQVGIAKAAKEEGINDESPNSSATNIHVPDPFMTQLQQNLNFDRATNIHVPDPFMTQLQQNLNFDSDANENEGNEQIKQPAISSTKSVIRSPSCDLMKESYESQIDGEAKDQAISHNDLLLCHQ